MRVIFCDFDFHGQHYNSCPIDLPGVENIEALPWREIRKTALQTLQQLQDEAAGYASEQLYELCYIFSACEEDADEIHEALMRAGVKSIPALRETGVIPLRAALNPQKLDIISKMIDGIAQASAMIACGDTDKNIQAATGLPVAEIQKMRRDRKKEGKKK